MKIAMVGLGKMGLNMTSRLVEKRHAVIAFDVNASAVADAKRAGAECAETMHDIVDLLNGPRTVWVMVPSGDATEKTVTQLAQILSPGDIVIDGGNSHYKDSVRRAAYCREKGIHFVDVGTSGGIWGHAEGYSLMVGGEEDIVEYLRPLFESLAPAPDRGWGRVGTAGTGHYVKMIHNGIEYGMMEAYAEGFDILNTKKEFHFDLHQISEIWRYGSVIRSWLLDLSSEIFVEGGELGDVEAWVPDSGEGRWTLAEAIDQNVPAPVITLALEMRLVSRRQDNFSARVLAAMRNKFGGHEIRKKVKS